MKLSIGELNMSMCTLSFMLLAMIFQLGLSEGRDFNLATCTSSKVLTCSSLVVSVFCPKESTSKKK
jgi:hypothetical protein